MRSKLGSHHQRILPPGVHTCPKLHPTVGDSSSRRASTLLPPLGRKAASSRSAHLPKERERQKLHQTSCTAWADALGSLDGKDPHAAGDEAAKQNPGSINRTAQSTCSRQRSQKPETEEVEGRKWDRAGFQDSERACHQRWGENKDHSFLGGPKAPTMPGRRAEAVTAG